MRAQPLVYLDWAASAPMDDSALEELTSVSRQVYANPSSPHEAGRAASELLERARARMAGLLGARPRDIVFTSGGTEANTSLLLSLLDRHRLGGMERPRARVLTTAIEHSSVHDQAQMLRSHGIDAVFVAPRPDGRVDPQSVADALDDATLLVSVMLVNNETGALQDLAGIVAAVRSFSASRGRRILIHTDAVQAFGKIPFRPAELGVDAASMSGHKLGGPRGVGVLYLRGELSPGFLATGGGQESGRRPGTENLPGICAMTRAAETRLSMMKENLSAAAALSSRLVEGLRGITGAWVIPLNREAEDPGRYSPWIVSAGFPPLPAEVVVRAAEARGFCIATGSACSTRKKDRTRVPESMGLAPETARSVVRISLGPSTTTEQVDGLLAALREDVPPLLAVSKGRRA